MRHTNDVYGFYHVRPGDTVSGLLVRIHGLTPREAARYLPAVAQNNPHIADLNHIRPGQFLDLGLQSTDPFSLMSRGSDLTEMERLYSALTVQQRAVVTESPHVLSWIAGLLGDATLNSVDSGFNALEKLVENYRNLVARYGRELAQAYASNQRGTLATELRNKILSQQPVKEALERVPRFLSDQFSRVGKDFLQPLNVKHNAIMKEVRQFLRIAPKRLGAYNPFSRGLASMTRVMNLAKLGGVATTWVIPTSIALYDSAQAWGTDAWGRVTSSGAGKVLGGVAGAPAAYGACNLLLGVETAGTSLFWCALIVGAPAGMLLSETGGRVGGGIYDVVNGGAKPGVIVSDQCRIPGR